jgi:2-polyprenyl-3-methyl-5-hydroxy-6-metoxy-1,4-benzoquinol methylase
VEKQHVGKPSGGNCGKFLESAASEKLRNATEIIATMVDPSHDVPAPTNSPRLTSHQAAIFRFDQAEVAENYPTQFGEGWRDRREVRSLRRALARVPAGAHVLDLPCGAGRLLDILLNLGYRVTCADSSEHMTRMARRRWDAIRSIALSDMPEPNFAVRDVMQTGYPDGYFDAIVCNRLFHHFRESETRIRALSELRRVSRGPVIVSFFNAFALGAIRFQLTHAMRRTVPVDRVPIPAWNFLNDVRRAGLTPVAMHAATWGISPLWHVVSLPAAGRNANVISRDSGRRSKAG